MNRTTVVQIGNSDDKLKQADWAQFVRLVNNLINESADVIHFHGHSDPKQSWQNACWVLEWHDDRVRNEMLAHLRFVAASFLQDSVAVTTGTTDLLSTAGSDAA